MGVFSEYLDSMHSYPEIQVERKKQLTRISEARGGSSVLVYAASFSSPSRVNPNIEYDDLLPFRDQLANLSGDRLDLIIESPGGSGEVAEDLVRAIRDKFSSFSVLVPGWAKSAATIIAMGADEIVMTPGGALGPIDAQLIRNGNRFSADAFLKGFDNIKDEVTDKGVLNKAYIPILQGISPGDIENARNALNFGKILVREWLAKYKFANWMEHSSTGKPVTEDERLERAEQIASALCDQSENWKTHGRSLKIEDLENLGLRITTADGDLADAMSRYYALLKMTHEQTAIYKLFETPTSQVARQVAPQQAGPPPVPIGGNKVPDAVELNVNCPKCGSGIRIQGNFKAGVPLKPENIAFPADNELDCPNCSARINLAEVRNKLESQTKRAIVT